MPDSTPTPHHADGPRAADPRAEAINWLAGQFRWEALLADLHDLAEREAAPVVPIDASAPTSTDENSEDAA